ncbi:MAG: hypothetical protein IJS55_07750 [Oscillospiraceae bacterium]|nr:hypothetical protein [Oscillospiraceae bacterium]MBQ7466405.1 hypothetical protein [Oscillospiraceae bacterium]
MADQRHSQKTTTYGSLAYDLDSLANDLDNLARRRQLEDAGVMPQRHNPPQAAPRRRSQPRRQARPQASAVTVACLTVLVGLVMVLMLGYVQLTKTGTEISRLKNQLSDLNSEHVQLVTTYERTFDLTTIKEVAEAAGMAKPNAGQIEYIDLSGDDSAVVYRTEAGSALHELYTTAQASLSGLWEYFR